MKLPEDGPDTLTLRAERVDGRTEESRYPNLMVPGVKQQYMWSIANTSTDHVIAYWHYWEEHDPDPDPYLYPPDHPL